MPREFKVCLLDFVGTLTTTTYCWFNCWKFEKACHQYFSNLHYRLRKKKMQEEEDQSRTTSILRSNQHKRMAQSIGRPVCQTKELGF